MVAYPTEAVYGLGCHPRNERAVRRILALKGRPWQKGLILIAARLDQLLPFIGPLNEALLERVSATWPGPSTWLLPARAGVPRWLRGEHDTLACRVTAHPQARRLCELAGTALVSTSANPAGASPARTTDQVLRYFPAGLDFVVAGAVGGHGAPTEIRDARTGRIVRPSAGSGHGPRFAR